jgi:hypothetical protein
MDSASHGGMLPKAFNVRQLLSNRANCKLTRHPRRRRMLGVFNVLRFNKYVISAGATNPLACQRFTIEVAEGLVLAF